MDFSLKKRKNMSINFVLWHAATVERKQISCFEYGLDFYMMFRSHTPAEFQLVPPPRKNIVPQTLAVSVDIDGTILPIILCSLMPISVVL
jgi:hypothetical protein